MASLRITISDDLHNFLNDQTRKGEYQSEQECVEALLRQEQRRKAGQEHLDNGQGKSAWEIAAAISRSVPQAEWDKLPRDLSKNVDHYLYGHPRENL